MLNILTNNPLIYETMGQNHFIATVDYKVSSYFDILFLAKLKVESGHKLLFYPMYGNVFPYEMQFKSVIMSEQKDYVDFTSLSVINNALTIAENAIYESESGVWDMENLEDLQKIDLLLVERWLTKIYVRDGA